MKKFLLLIIIVVLVIVFYDPITEKLGIKSKENKFIYQDILDNTSENVVNVSSFTIYGKHFNIKGILPSEEGSYTIVLKNNEKEKIVNTNIEDNTFNLGKYINSGLDLEKLEVGEYIILLKNTDKDIYYNLINNTNYHDNNYYTITKKGKNNHITFPELSFNDKKYWSIKIVEEKLPNDIYDIVIDPGHGGIDTGASNGKYHESKYTLEYGKALFDALTEEGLKVKLTRDSDIQIDHYGVGSRTGIPYETKAKLMLSIHLNSGASSKQKGVEIYKAYSDNNDYAKTIADNIVNEVGTVYSNNPMNKIIDGVYMRVYDNNDKKDLINTAKKGGFTPYEIDDTTTYYYFIRETGGIMTKAFSDGRNPKYNENPYRNSNQGVEAYLCELAYISQSDDLKLVLNKKNAFIKALKNSVLEYIDIEKTAQEDHS